MYKPDIEADPRDSYLMFIRNPLARFVSAFNHSKSLIDFDTSEYSFDMLINDKGTPYYGLKNKTANKLESGHPFDEGETGVEYECLMNNFESANALAESLSSNNDELKSKALSLMSNEQVEHISKGIGWYLHNGEFIEKNLRNISFVGTLENIGQDLNLLSELLKTDVNQSQYKRRNIYHYDKGLSDLAIGNLLEFYRPSDYKALGVLHRHGFISDETLEDYCEYHVLC